MEIEDKLLVKALGIQSLSSSVRSTPEKSRHSDNASRSPELLQEFLKSDLKRELLRTCLDKQKKTLASLKSKMNEPSKPSNNKTIKKQEVRKASTSPSKEPASKKKNRKGENPTRVPPVTEQSPDLGYSGSLICKNSACRAFMSLDDVFCRRCSCCICHSFDDNKDPSLWLVCSSDCSSEGSCGLCCHIECALQSKRVGVSDLGQLMQLDGSYCCASCGKVSGILEFWKKQLAVAKDARRPDILCYRIDLSHRLLSGTSRFKELLEIVTDAKAKLVAEVGPLNSSSAKMARGIVSRLSVAADVQKLCSLGIEKVEELLATSHNKTQTEDSRPAACKILFEEVKPFSVVIILIESPCDSSDDVKGYKLWHCKSGEEMCSEQPVTVIPRDQRRILISNLEPGTEYTFKLVSYTEAGDFGLSEVKCLTRGTQFLHNSDPNNPLSGVNGNNQSALNGGRCGRGNGESLGLEAGGLQNILRLASAPRQGQPGPETALKVERSLVSRGLDLNVASVPDLNEELTPASETFRDEGNGCASQDIKKSTAVGAERNNLVWIGDPAAEKKPLVNSRIVLCRKRARGTREDPHDCDSILTNGSPGDIADGSNCLGENFEYCVKTIRQLECEGHISQDFRLKFLTWFSLRSTEQERRVVNTFVQTMVDDPTSLAEQLVDSFSEKVSSKKQQSDFCTKLRH